MPPGLRSGSLAAEKAKCAALTEHVQLQQQEIERLGSLPFDPSKVPGLLDPTPHEVKKRARSQARASQSEGGSATIPDLYGESQANKKKREDEAARLEAVRDDRATKKTAATEAAAKLAADFERCPGKGKCSCGAMPCPMRSTSYASTAPSRCQSSGNARSGHVWRPGSGQSSLSRSWARQSSHSPGHETVVFAFTGLPIS